MQILIVEIIEHKPEDDQIRFHGHSVDLEKFQLLIGGVTGYARINDLESIRTVSVVEVQSALQQCRIKFAGARFSGPDQGIAQKKDAKDTRFLWAYFPVSQS